MSCEVALHGVNNLKVVADDYITIIISYVWTGFFLIWPQKVHTLKECLNALKEAYSELYCSEKCDNEWDGYMECICQKECTSINQPS
jgi:hypothetical protein